jgi:hypothetical protein
MHEMFFAQGNRSELQKLLTFWGGKAEEVLLSIEWIGENLLETRIEMTNLNFMMKNFMNQHIVSPLRKHVINNSQNFQIAADEHVQCVSEEICLALQYNPVPIPIMCTETSSWKIVEIMRRSGAMIKEGIIEYSERKKEFFRENWKQVLSKVAGVAFIWMFGGPNAGLEKLGMSGITLAIEDP